MCRDGAPPFERSPRQIDDAERDERSRQRPWCGIAQEDVVDDPGEDDGADDHCGSRRESESDRHPQIPTRTLRKGEQAPVDRFGPVGRGLLSLSGERS